MKAGSGKITQFGKDTCQNLQDYGQLQKRKQPAQPERMSVPILLACQLKYQIQNLGLNAHLAQEACKVARLDVGLQIVGGAELIAFSVALVPRVSQVTGRAYHQQRDQHAYVHLKPVEAALQLLLHRCTDAQKPPVSRCTDLSNTAHEPAPTHLVQEQGCNLDRWAVQIEQELCVRL